MVAGCCVLAVANKFRNSNKGKTNTVEKRRPDLVLVDHSTQEPQQDSCLWRYLTGSCATTGMDFILHVERS